MTRYNEPVQLIFTRDRSPKSLGGNLYEWKETETKFVVFKNAKYLIKITASAKNAKQNFSADDDDLRVALDAYEFGKYEMHEEKVSWKGFGTASSWDGASLKGGAKTIYFFIELQEGEHTLRFYADGTPLLQEISVFHIAKNEKIEIEKLRPPQNLYIDRKGIPWMSFIFLGVKPKDFAIGCKVKSAVQKRTQDGDNLKVIVNGRILQNPKASTSRKYKNFYFSGDLNKGKSEALIISPKEFEFFEDSIELWYDENPSIYINTELFDSIESWLETGIPEKIKLKFYELILHAIAKGFYLLRYRHAHNFLRRSLTHKSDKLTFHSKSSLVKKIKKDKAYQKVLSIIKTRIRQKILDGQIIPGNERENLDINFEEGDLKFSLHGLKKIYYSASENKPNRFDVHFTLFDIYDFDPAGYDFPISIPLNIADALEKKHRLENFEIEIEIFDTITL